ncbi:unnamed protein product [Candidula unifasciata]|uniref:Fibronectin type-III domain-containing protein n=1 Tax=Candidula unifasciata TaxID=100452 RepID=A0A8S3ZDQ6_9EUPU|nr:unnamed protein product [Candidula unifasciata]
MGANQSNAEELSRDQSWAGNSQNKGHNSSGSAYNYNQGMLDKNKKSKAKPNPPIRIKFLDVTHNAIKLTWHAPLGPEGHSIIAYTVEMATICPGRDSLWRILSTCCQGTTYEARYLEPDTDYVFRVRSENIYGVGKPSHPSDICTTKMYETFPADLRPPGVSHNSLIESGSFAKRHYSFNMHIGKGVKSILNHSEIDIESRLSSNSSFGSTSDTLKKPHTFLRSNIHRTSLPTNRKISAPLLLPGTRNNSLNRLRESRKCSKTETSDIKLRTSIRDSGISGLQESLTVFDSSSVNSQFSEEHGDEKNHDFIRSHRLPVHSHTLCAKSIDGDSGKGSKSSLCDSMKISDSQSIIDSTDSEITVSDRKSVAVNSSTDSCENIDMLSDIDENVDIYKTSSLVHFKNADIYQKNPVGEIDEHTPVCKSPEKLNKVYFNDQNLVKNPPCDSNIQSADAVFTRDSQKQEYYDTLDNPWQKDTPVTDTGNQILTAPVSDDVKMALYNKNPRNQRFTTGRGRCISGLATKEETDFRKLKSVLQSSNVIMKTSRSLPDVVAIVTVNGKTKTVIKGKLTTILNSGANEDDDDAVRITTL